MQFKNESGFGRGVTQGFYSSVCNALQSPEENANVCMWTQGRSGSGLTGKESQKNVLGGNRGLFPNAWPHADVSRYKSREEQAARRKILGRFRFLGRLLSGGSMMWSELSYLERLVRRLGVADRKLQPRS